MTDRGSRRLLMAGLPVLLAAGSWLALFITDISLAPKGDPLPREVHSMWINTTILVAMGGLTALAAWWVDDRRTRSLAALQAHLDKRLDKIEETQPIPIAMYRPAVGIAAVSHSSTAQPAAATRRRRRRSPSRSTGALPDNVRAFELGRRAGRDEGRSG